MLDDYANKLLVLNVNQAKKCETEQQSVIFKSHTNNPKILKSSVIDDCHLVYMQIA